MKKTKEQLELEKQQEKEAKLASLKNFARVSQDDPEVVEIVTEQLKEDHVAQLQRQIDRLDAEKAELQAKLNSLR